MSSFTTHTSIEPDKDKWINNRTFTYYLNDSMQWDYIMVPKWFRFDWASIPRLFWIIYPPVEPDTITSACLHDYLFRIKIFWLYKTNLIFLDSLRINWVWKFKRYTMFFWLLCWSWYIRYFKKSKY